jgi:hypothetical protein
MMFLLKRGRTEVEERNSVELIFCRIMATSSVMSSEV